MIQFVACIFLLVGGCASTDAASVSENVNSSFIRLYNRDGPYVDFSLTNASELASYLDGNTSVIMYIHGSTESVDADTVTSVTTAFLQYTIHNILALDYRKIAALSYPVAVQEVQPLCAAVAKIIQQLINDGVDAKNIYIIGASLGGQLSGCIGRSVTPKIARITGLDPAGPLFYIANRHLSASDADFVDIIHTDAGFFGEALPSGSTNFYPNFGYGIQPGCKSEINVTSIALCGHRRSVLFYIESLKNRNAFIGVKCSNELLYRSGACNGNERAVMGYYASPNKKGIYYLRTGASEPFGLGEAGAPYRSSSS